MRAVVYEKAESFNVEDIVESKLNSGEVRLRVLASGVCGTDRHIHEGGFGVRFPVTPGHEMVGEVIERAVDVDFVEVGDRVVVDNVLVCGRCDQCRQGRGGLCRNLGAYGLTHPGSVAETIIVPARKCEPVGDLDPEVAVLAEPVACVVHGLDVLQLRPASDVLVVGAGPTGQILSQLLARGGAARVTVAAPTPFKLEVARRNGADHVVQTDREDFSASVSALRQLAPLGFDVVIDATGATAVLDHALSLVRDGGTLMVYGMAAEHATVSVSPYELFRRELTIKGSFSQTNCVGRAVALLASGRVRADGLITHRFALNEYASALDALGDPNCLKAIVVPTVERAA